MLRLVPPEREELGSLSNNLGGLEANLEVVGRRARQIIRIHDVDVQLQSESVAPLALMGALQHTVVDMRWELESTWRDSDFGAGHCD